jgi:hypothetical protein
MGLMRLREGSFFLSFFTRAEGHARTHTQATCIPSSRRARACVRVCACVCVRRVSCAVGVLFLWAQIIFVLCISGFPGFVYFTLPQL